MIEVLSWEHLDVLICKHLFNQDVEFDTEKMSAVGGVKFAGIIPHYSTNMGDTWKALSLIDIGGHSISLVTSSVGWSCCILISEQYYLSDEQTSCLAICKSLLMTKGVEVSFEKMQPTVTSG